MRRTVMIKYRGSHLIRAGFIGVVLIMLVIAIGLQPERLGQWATTIRYQALFTEAGGLTKGNDVTFSGIKVGTVDGVSLQTAKRWSISPSKGGTHSGRTPPRTFGRAPCSVSAC